MNKITYKSTKTVCLTTQFNFSWLYLTRKRSSQKRRIWHLQKWTQSTVVILLRFNSCCLDNAKTRSLLAFIYNWTEISTDTFFLKRKLGFVESNSSVKITMLKSKQGSKPLLHHHHPITLSVTEAFQVAPRASYIV